MQTTKPYRTPLLKLVRFFQSSRDGWKAKYLELKQLTRRQDGQVRSLQRSRDKWKQEARQLRTELTRIKKRPGLGSREGSVPRRAIAGRQRGIAG